MKAVGQPKQASLNEQPKICALCMLVHRFLCNVNDTRALIGPCSLVTSPLCQIRNPLHVQPSTITHIVIGPLLHINSFLILIYGLVLDVVDEFDGQDVATGLMLSS